MKKMLFILMALLIASPVMAASITISGTGGVLTGQVSYSGATQAAKPDPGRPAAFALVLTADSGATFTGVTATRNTVSTAAAPGYGIFPGSIVINSSGVVTNVGSPVEPATLPGASASGIGTNKIVVALGALYSGDANKPAAAGNLFGFTTSGACNVTVAVESTYRGGVVAEDASAMTVNFSGTPIVITAPVSECVKNTAPIYADWVAFGKPACWCYARNCRGDADGLKQGSVALGYSFVYTNDLNIVSAAWNVKEAPKGPGILSIPNGICADFARDKQGSVALGYARVYTNDLNIVSTYWNVKEAPKGPGIPDCMSTGNYNTLTNY